MGERDSWVQDFGKFLEDSLRDSARLLEDVALAIEDVAIEIDQAIAESLAPLVDLIVDVEMALDEATQPLSQTVNPALDNHPACIGCRHYHGQSYSGNFLVCGMHPYGTGEATCPDWESTWENP